MKKFVSLLTVVIVAAVLAVALAACNNATTQGQLVDAWKNARPYQRYTYSVTDSAFEGSEGEYESVITYHKAYNADKNSPAYNTDRVIIGGRTIEQREGYLISNTLYIKLGGVEYRYVTECYFILTDGSKEYYAPDSISGNTITLERCDYPRLTLCLNDELVNLNRPVTVRYAGRTLFRGRLRRTAATIRRTAAQRRDPRLVYTAEVTVSVPSADRP